MMRFREIPRLYANAMGSATVFVALVGAALWLSFGRTSEAQEVWSLARVEAVLTDYPRPDVESNCVVRAYGGAELPIPSGSISLNSVNGLRDGYPDWSGIPWTLDAVVSYDFPATVPVGETRDGTVSASATFTDPRDPATSPYPALAVHTIIRNGLSWCPLPPTPVSPSFSLYGFSFYSSVPLDSASSSLRGGTQRLDAQATRPFGSTFAYYDGAENIFYVQVYGSSDYTTGNTGSRYLWIYPVYVQGDPPLPPIRVDNLGDGRDTDYSEGNQTLRDALFRAGTEQAGNGVYIPFTVTGTVQLTSEVIFPEKAELVTLATTAGDVTVRGNGCRVFQIPTGSNVRLSGLTIKEGSAGTEGGGGILNLGKLELIQCLLRQNRTDTAGGGILNTGDLTMTGCAIAANYGNSGGGVANGGKLRAEGCLFTLNISDHFGADLISVNGGTNYLRDCEFSGSRCGYDDGHLGSISICAGGSLDAVNCRMFDLWAPVVAYDGGVCRLRHCAVLGNCTYAIISRGTSSFVTIGHCLLDVLHCNRNSTIDAREGGRIVSLGYNLVPKSPDDYERAVTDITNKPAQIGYSPDGSATLLAFSPAVNAGNPDFTPDDFDPPLTKDINGNDRLVGTIDIGAVEVSGDKLFALALLQAQNGNEDGNNNGVPDYIDVLTGVDPATDGACVPPLTIHQGNGAQAAAAALPLSGLQRVCRTASEGGSMGVELRLDERADFMEGMLQTSDDLMTWTDRATYRPLGAGLGCERVNVNGAALVGHEQAGFCWFVREDVGFTGRKGYARLKAILRTVADDFDGTTLDSDWTVVSPNPDSAVSLSGDGWLDISASPLNGGSDLSADTNRDAPRLLCAIDPSDDWIAETMFTFSPSNDCQDAGLLLARTATPSDDAGDYWKIANRAYDLADGGSVVRLAGGSQVTAYAGATTFLWAQKKGTAYTSWWSADGTNWSAGATTTNAGSWSYVGLAVTRLPKDGNIGVYADAAFDYLRIAITPRGDGGPVPAPEIAVEQPAGTDLADESATVSFGSGLVGATNTLTFTIRNTGSADLTGLGITIDGSNAIDFVVTSTPSAPVSGPSGSTTFTVAFTPSALGARSADLHIASNDGDENPFDIALTGGGMTAGQIVQEAYLKSSDTSASDGFGFSVSASGDTVVVGSIRLEAVCVFVRSGSTERG